MNFKKKTGRVFTSKFVGTGPSSYKKKNLPGHGLTKVEKHYYIIIDISGVAWFRLGIWKRRGSSGEGIETER